MTDEAQTAAWPPALLNDIRAAVGRLEAHDAHCSLEAAVLLNAAWDILIAPGGVWHWDGIVGAISRLAELGERHGVNLPPDTVAFIDAVLEARKSWGGNRDLSEVFVPGTATLEGGLAWLEQRLALNGPDEMINVRREDDARAQQFEVPLGELVESLRAVAEKHCKEG